MLRVFTGFLLVRYPLIGALSLTLAPGDRCSSSVAIFRAVGAASLRFPQWGWTAASGVIGVLLGVMLLCQLPASSLWFLGLAVGHRPHLRGQRADGARQRAAAAARRILRWRRASAGRLAADGGTATTATPCRAARDALICVHRESD